MKNQQKEQQSECSLGKNTCRQGTLWGHSLSLKDSQTRCMGISCQKVSLQRFLCEGVDTQTQQHCVAIPVGGGEGEGWFGKIQLAEIGSFCSFENLEPSHCKRNTRAFWHSAKSLLCSWAHKSEDSPHSCQEREECACMEQGKQNWNGSRPPEIRHPHQRPTIRGKEEETLPQQLVTRAE